MDLVHYCHTAQLIYLHPLKTHFPLISDDVSRLHRFERDVRGLFAHTLPPDHVVRYLEAFFRQQVGAIVGTSRMTEDQPMRDAIPTIQHEAARLLQGLQVVGLGGAPAQRALAEAMWDALHSHVELEYAGRWTSPSNVGEDLAHWIENEFARFIVETLTILREDATDSTKDEAIIPQTEVERWKEMGNSQLGRLRTDELFDIVVEWDETKGAIEDLHNYVSSPATRAYLTNTFSSTLNHRLLHPGASTIQILQVYIAIIRSFTALDPKGVLLERIARPIRRYLRDREDTVHIVVGGLLADPDAEDDIDHSATSGDVLIDLAQEMNKNHSLKHDEDATDPDIDFDDMSWMPDPVDAGADFKKSKDSDVIGSLISLFETRNVFVQEFQKILGERLLKHENDFEREIRVLELLKVRFGEPALQACEVMLRDVLDSRRVDVSIQKDKAQMVSIDPTRPVPMLHARILSHLYWPALHSEAFMVPAEIGALQVAYSQAFSRIKASRKLTWLHALGQVTVTLDLEDRTVIETVQTWQASVINAFQPNDHDMDDELVPVTRSLSYLAGRLAMDASLVLNAVTFWVGKLVLRQSSPDTYTVLETLSDEAAAHPGTASAAIAAAAETATAAAAPAILSEHEVAKEKMDVYAQYVVGMLTNGGPMPLQQIVMMLKLTVAEGFPFANEELKDYLDEEVKSGRLDLTGGNYKIAGR